MTDRARFLAILNYEQPDEPLLMQWMGFAGPLQLRWRKEGGLPEDVSPNSYFGLSSAANLPVTVFPYPERDEILLEEGETHRIVLNNRDLKVLRDEKAPHFPKYLESPIKTRDDWERYKERINRGCEGRFDRLRDRADTYRNSDRPVILGLRGCWEIRYFVGMTEVLLMFHDDPAFIEEMLAFWFAHQWEIIDSVCDVVVPDAVCMWEDIAYKNGPFMSPAFYDHFFAPYHRETAARVKARGVSHFLLDIDGRIDELLPRFIENGVTGIFPLECQSDADPVKFRKQFGQTIQMIGGIDKRALIEGVDATAREVRHKLTNLVPGSGFIPGIDHSVPLEVSLETFQFYVDCLRDTWQGLLK